MKLEKLLIVLINILLVFYLLISCNHQSSPIKHEKNIGMETVLYNGWRDYVSDGVYVISCDFDGYVKKYNIKTGGVSRVCDCGERCEDNCLMRRSNRVKLYSIHTGKLYYSSFDIKFDVNQNDANNEATQVHYLASYDLTTHESKKLFEMNASEYQTFQARCFKDEYAYYIQNIPNVIDPKGEKDYTLSFCRMNLNTLKEEVLFTEKEQPYLAHATPQFILDDCLIFGDNSIGHLWKVDYQGQNFQWIVKAGNDAPALLDAYGVFYTKGYIYYTVYINDVDSTMQLQKGLYIYRVDINGGIPQQLSDSVVQWLFVTDDYIFYEYAYDGQSALNEHHFGYMNHDGEDAQLLPTLITEKYGISIISGVWFDSGSFYFMCGCGESIDAQRTIKTIKYDIATGKHVEIIAYGES